MTRDDFVKEVVKRRDSIIPIVGDAAFVCNWEHGKNEPLPIYILRHLSDEDTDYKVSNYYHDVTRIEGKKGDVSDKIKEIVDNGKTHGEIHLNSDVYKFLKAGKFEVIITTNCFKLLDDLFPTYNKSIFNPGNIESGELSTPAIYAVFGDIYNSDWVDDEVMLLRFLHFLQGDGKEKGKGANRLVNYMTSKSNGMPFLLPIGCQTLPNWIFRLLWYPMSGVCAGKQTKHDKGGFWCSDTKDFMTFLESEGFWYTNPDNEEDYNIFTELSEKLRGPSQHLVEGVGVEWREEEKWDYFLSYSRESGIIPKSVIKLYERLGQGLKKNVWMDNREIGVGDYWEAIKYGVDHSCRIIIVISTRYLEKLKDKSYWDNEARCMKEYGVWTELAEIIAEKQKINPKKILPIVIKGAEYENHLGEKIEISNSNLKIIEDLPGMPKYYNSINCTKKVFEHAETYYFDPNNPAEFNPLHI